MRLLLDTHALLWWTAGDARLSSAARAAVNDEVNEIFVSAASAWEITTKVRLGKLPAAVILAQDVEANILLDGFEPLPIAMRHAQLAGTLQGSHKDPFDRMLIAQSLAEGLAIVSNESLFDAYGVIRLW